MYIESLGLSGCLHLCKEIIDNNRDECIKPDSPGNLIEIEINDKYIRTSDNGRGIPTHLVRRIHEIIQAGSNMKRSSGNTSGENGCGSACFTALSSKLIIVSKRPQEKKMITLTYKNGKCVNEELVDYNGKEHGLSTYFAPSKKTLGCDVIPVDDLIEWLNYPPPKKANKLIHKKSFLLTCSISTFFLILSTKNNK